MIHQAVSWDGLAALSFLLAIVFIAAGTSKLIDRVRFERTLPPFGIRPGRLSSVLSYAIPATELTLGFFSATGLAPFWAALAMLILLALFTAQILRLLLLGKSAACACFGGVSTSKLTWNTAWRNAVLLLAVGLNVVWSAPVGAASYFLAESALRLTLAVPVAHVVLIVNHWWSIRPELAQAVAALVEEVE